MRAVGVFKLILENEEVNVERARAWAGSRQEHGFGSQAAGIVSQPLIFSFFLYPEKAFPQKANKLLRPLLLRSHLLDSPSLRSAFSMSQTLSPSAPASGNHGGYFGDGAADPLGSQEKREIWVHLSSDSWKRPPVGPGQRDRCEVSDADCNISETSHWWVTVHLLLFQWNIS